MGEFERRLDQLSNDDLVQLLGGWHCCWVGGAAAGWVVQLLGGWRCCWVGGAAAAWVWCSR